MQETKRTIPKKACQLCILDEERSRGKCPNEFSEDFFKTRLFPMEGPSVSIPCKQILCTLDHLNPFVFIMEIANSLDTFTDNCYRHKFHKYMYMRQCITLNKAFSPRHPILALSPSLPRVSRARVLVFPSQLNLIYEESSS